MSPYLALVHEGSLQRTHDLREAYLTLVPNIIPLTLHAQRSAGVRGSLPTDPEAAASTVFEEMAHDLCTRYCA